MTNIRCKGKREIDLLAIDPKTGQKFHIESTVWTNRKLNLRTLEQLVETKFNDPRVKERIREFFGESEYKRWLVVSPQKVDSQLDEIARNKFDLEIEYIDTMLRMIMRKLRFGSRDQVSRILEIVKLKEDFDRKHFVHTVKKSRLLSEH
jgi:hypothetical protein